MLCQTTRDFEILCYEMIVSLLYCILKIKKVWKIEKLLSLL